jgi:hypothetical protein
MPSSTGSDPSSKGVRDELGHWEVNVRSVHALLNERREVLFGALKDPPKALGAGAEVSICATFWAVRKLVGFGPILCRRSRFMRAREVDKANVGSWQGATQRLKEETYTLYLAYRDPRGPLTPGSSSPR